MTLRSRIGIFLSLGVLAGAFAVAQEHEHGGGGRPPAHGEPYPGPTRYERVTEPNGWNNRPATVDRGVYEHNYQVTRAYHIGVYHRPPGWVAHRWVYGEVLPRAYWAPPYLIADYWLFALMVPPVGYEWVRDDTDAILVNVATGQILQVQYGVFG
ncbi:MAG TPA: RcnB family protein [Steroidobacteraceae bacterium]|nr:RcnB family protein [Steroidobacteraceae bacterium]